MNSRRYDPTCATVLDWLECTNVRLKDRVKFVEDWINIHIDPLKLPVRKQFTEKDNSLCFLERFALLLEACCIKDLGSALLKKDNILKRIPLSILTLLFFSARESIHVFESQYFCQEILWHLSASESMVKNLLDGCSQ